GRAPRRRVGLTRSLLCRHRIFIRQEPIPVPNLLRESAGGAFRRGGPLDWAERAGLVVNPRARSVPTSRRNRVASARAVELLKDGMAVPKSSDKVKAGPLLRPALALAPRNEVALLWLAGLAESPLEAVGHLEGVLAVTPTHEKAQAAVKAARLQAGIAAAK